MDVIPVKIFFNKPFVAGIAKNAGGVPDVLGGKESLIGNNFDPDFPGTGPVKFAEE
jgi:hypothetical protein